MEFSISLKRQRKQKGLSQEDVARHLGVSKSTVSNWETGYSAPNQDVLVRLADFLDISADELLGRVSVREKEGRTENLPLAKESITLHIYLETTEPDKFLHPSEAALTVETTRFSEGRFFGVLAKADIPFTPVRKGAGLILRVQEHGESGDIVFASVGAAPPDFWRYGKSVDGEDMISNCRKQDSVPEIHKISGSDVKIFGKVVKVIVDL